jgi:hypothetical protein
VDERQKHPACIACGKSKRRCSKQRPACLRCRSRGLRCAYPETRIVLYSDDALEPAAAAAAAAAAAGTRASGNGLSSSYSDAVAHPVMNMTPPGSANTPDQSHSGALSPSSRNPRTRQELARHVGPLDHPWFLAPSSWDINNNPMDDHKIAYPDSGLDGFVDLLRSWFDQWTSSNHCPIIHSRLFGTDLPETLQYAYSAYQTYRSSSDINRRVALKIASTWSRQIVADQSIYDSLGVTALDHKAHLSRTLALLVFQLICLFDGDIRARAEAEATSATLMRWSDALMQRAAMEVSVHQQYSPAGVQDESAAGLPHASDLRPDGTLASQWSAWLLSESVRRVWITATLFEAAFLIKKDGSASCPGSISFSGTNGLWDATSPHNWLQSLRAAGEARFPVHCEGLMELLSSASPSEVDEFTHALLIYGSGTELCEDWRAAAS